MVHTLKKLASSETEPQSEGILLHGVYAMQRERAWMSRICGEIILYGGAVPSVGSELEDLLVGAL